MAEMQSSGKVTRSRAQIQILSLTCRLHIRPPYFTGAKKERDVRAVLTTPGQAQLVTQVGKGLARVATFVDGDLGKNSSFCSIFHLNALLNNDMMCQD